MVISSFVICAGLLLCIAAGSVAVLAVGVGIVGFAGAVFGLARQSYLTEVVPLELRARALSTLGGSMRIGAFIGPFLAAWVTTWAGTAGAYWIFVICAFAAGVLVLVVKDLSPPKGARRRAASAASRRTFRPARRGGAPQGGVAVTRDVRPAADGGTAGPAERAPPVV